VINEDIRCAVLSYGSSWVIELKDRQ